MNSSSTTADHPAAPEVWVVVLKPEGRDGPPMPVRVKRLLKVALRAFRLRCVCVRTPTPAELAAATERPTEVKRP